MKRALVLALSAMVGVSLVGCETSQKVAVDKTEKVGKEVMMDAIKGELAYRERVALPPQAVVTVILQDISLMDVAAKTIAEQTFTTDGGQVPLDFELSYDANQIELGHSYSVRATIKVDGKLRFTTDTVYPVITDPVATKEVQLMLVGVGN